MTFICFLDETAADDSANEVEINGKSQQQLSNCK